jgi:hypothetical protein
MAAISDESVIAFKHMSVRLEEKNAGKSVDDRASVRRPVRSRLDHPKWSSSRGGKYTRAAGEIGKVRIGG